MNRPVLVVVVEREAEVADVAEDGEPRELLAGDRGVVDDRVAGFVVGGGARLRLGQALGRRGELGVVLRDLDAGRRASLGADLDDELDLGLGVVPADERPIRQIRVELETHPMRAQRRRRAADLRQRGRDDVIEPVGGHVAQAAGALVGGVEQVAEGPVERLVHAHLDPERGVAVENAGDELPGHVPGDGVRERLEEDDVGHAPKKGLRDAAFAEHPAHLVGRLELPPDVLADLVGIRPLEVVFPVVAGQGDRRIC